MQDPLAQLRDIHTPDAVSAWPLATGWWLVLALLLILVLAVFWLLKRRRSKRLAQQQKRPDYRHWASTQLHAYYADWQAHQNQRAFLQQAQALLRRIAIERVGSAQVASLTGKAWCRWLYEQSQQPEFLKGVGQVLAAGGYQPDPDYDVTALYELLDSWIDLSSQATERQAEREACNADV